MRERSARRAVPDRRGLLTDAQELDLQGRLLTLALRQVRGDPEREDDPPDDAPPPPRRPVRADGWTVERQRRFLAVLAETGLVTQAAAAAGLTARSAHRLRARPDGRAFAVAWDHALTLASTRLVELAFERAIDGAVTVTTRDGEEVRRTQAPSDRMLCFLLTHLHGDRFGPARRPARRAPTPAGAAEALPRWSRRLADADDAPLADVAPAADRAAQPAAAQPAVDEPAAAEPPALDPAPAHPDPAPPTAAPPASAIPADAALPNRRARRAEARAARIAKARGGAPAAPGSGARTEARDGRPPG